MEDWKTLYEKQIQKFDNIDKYILKNLRKKKVYLKAIKNMQLIKKLLNVDVVLAKYQLIFKIMDMMLQQ